MPRSCSRMKGEAGKIDYSLSFFLLARSSRQSPRSDLTGRLVELERGLVVEFDHERKRKRAERPGLFLRATGERLSGTAAGFFLDKDIYQVSDFWSGGHRHDIEYAVVWVKNGKIT